MVFGENTVAFPAEISSLLVFFLFHFSIFPGIRHFSTLDKIDALIDKLSVFYVACSFGTTVFVYTTNNPQ